MIEVYSSKGSGKVNEDTFGYTKNRFWVIDGATSISDKAFFSNISDANFLVSMFSSELNKIAENSNEPNRELLFNAMKNLSNKLKKKKFSYSDKPYQPSFAIACVSIVDNTVSLDILSDCYVIIKKNNSIEIFTDKRIERVAQCTNGLKDKIKKDNIPSDIAKDLLKEQIRKNRRKMNTSDGYWVGTIDGEAFTQMYSRSFNFEGIDEILICSDGFYRIFLNNLMTIEEFFKLNISLENAINILREYESNNENVEYKKNDDSTAIKIVF